MPINAILLSILACFFWGIIFIVPLFLGDFCCIDIALGRYLSYGLVSLALFAFVTQGVQRLKQHWKIAFLFASIMNVGYYTTVALGVRYSSASIVALLMGIAPISIGLLGNTGGLKEISKTLLIPGLLIFLGLGFVNFEALSGGWSSQTPHDFGWGIFFALLALAAWTWYVVANTNFLTQNPDIDPKDWTSIVGVMTLGVAFVAILGRISILEREYLDQFLNLKGSGLRFIALVSTLGILCSWIGTTLWNMASRQLPAALSGQLAILETIFGLLFVYTLEERLPTLLELLGICLIFAGVLRGVKAFHQKKCAAH